MLVLSYSSINWIKMILSTKLRMGFNLCNVLIVRRMIGKVKHNRVASGCHTLQLHPCNDRELAHEERSRYHLTGSLSHLLIV